MEPVYTVYIIKCRDGTYYTGFTQNFEKRLKAHQNKEIFYTKNRLPITVNFVGKFSNKQKAYDFERYLKSGSGVAFRNKRLA